jgi:hypothetical protein
MLLRQAAKEAVDRQPRRFPTEKRSLSLPIQLVLDLAVASLDVFRSTPQLSNALSAPNDLLVPTISDHIYGHILMSDRSTATFVTKHLPASMTGSVMKVSTLARRSLSAKASSRPASHGAATVGSRVLTLLVVTSAAKPVASASSRCLRKKLLRGAIWHSLNTLPPNSNSSKPCWAT